MGLSTLHRIALSVLVHGAFEKGGTSHAVHIGPRGEHTQQEYIVTVHDIDCTLSGISVPESVMVAVSFF